MGRNQPLFDLYGYVSTEKGIKNFKAINAFQTLYSSAWTMYTKQQFLANGLIVTHEKNDIQCDSLIASMATLALNSELNFFLLTFFIRQ